MGQALGSTIAFEGWGQVSCLVKAVRWRGQFLLGLYHHRCRVDSSLLNTVAFEGQDQLFHSHATMASSPVLSRFGMGPALHSPWISTLSLVVAQTKDIHLVFGGSRSLLLQAPDSNMVLGSSLGQNITMASAQASQRVFSTLTSPFLPPFIVHKPFRFSLTCLSPTY